MENVYGIPQHADTFSLKDTSGSDPYRLYNLDVFEYELWNPMALYAAIPFMMGHTGAHTTGLFWLNAAEGWIDIKKERRGTLVMRATIKQELLFHIEVYSLVHCFFPVS